EYHILAQSSAPPAGWSIGWSDISAPLVFASVLAQCVFGLPSTASASAPPVRLSSTRPDRLPPVAPPNGSPTGDGPRRGGRLPLGAGFVPAAEPSSGVVVLGF